jgi:hypothetical protein
VAECNNLGGAYIRKNVIFLRWRGEKLGTGNHKLTLTATDAAGNVTTDTLNVSQPQLQPLTLASITPTS